MPMHNLWVDLLLNPGLEPMGYVWRTESVQIIEQNRALEGEVTSSHTSLPYTLPFWPKVPRPDRRNAVDSDIRKLSPYVPLRLGYHFKRNLQLQGWHLVSCFSSQNTDIQCWWWMETVCSHSHRHRRRVSGLLMQNRANEHRYLAGIK